MILSLPLLTALDKRLPLHCDSNRSHSSFTAYGRLSGDATVAFSFCIFFPCGQLLQEKFALSFKIRPISEELGRPGKQKEVINVVSRHKNWEEKHGSYRYAYS